MNARRQFALAKQLKLLNGMKEIAIEKGAVPTPDGFYQFQLQTCVGLLRLSMPEGHSLASVFCRFEEAKRAVELIGRHQMNAYSGKWNHHWGKEDDPEIALRLFKADLERLTANVPGTPSTPRENRHV
jgi:hypothetical protein